MGHCKTYRDTDSTGSHQIWLVIEFRVRVKFRVGDSSLARRVICPKCIGIGLGLVRVRVMVRFSIKFRNLHNSISHK